MSELLPYRRNVGAVLFDRRGRVFLGRRTDLPFDGQVGGAWQLPQGGIDEGETPEQAVMRELEEEVGTSKARILGRHPEWLTYDFPPELMLNPMKGRFRGQMQCWFALLFLGTDDDIRLDLHHPEFDAWRWEDLSQLPAVAVSFKRPIYETLAREFAKYVAQARAVA